MSVKLIFLSEQFHSPIFDELSESLWPISDIEEFSILFMWELNFERLNIIHSQRQLVNIVSNILDLIVLLFQRIDVKKEVDDFVDCLSF